MPLNILQWDDSHVATLPKVDYNLYDTNVADYSNIPWKQYTLPTNAWAVPFVTGHTYKLHWNSGLDFFRFSFDVS
jgi:hypothetical protein